MKNIQPTTPVFVLTSLSFAAHENNITSQQLWQQKNEHRSSIAKFDYCLPPDEEDDAEAINSIID